MWVKEKCFFLVYQVHRMQLFSSRWHYMISFVFFSPSFYFFTNFFYIVFFFIPSSTHILFFLLYPPNELIVFPFFLLLAHCMSEKDIINTSLFDTSDLHLFDCTLNLTFRRHGLTVFLSDFIVPQLHLRSPEKKKQRQVVRER